MFDIGFWELSLIAVIALLILGPERLPRAARQAGLWAGKLKRMVNDVKSNINEELRMEELNALKQAGQELKNDLQSTQKELGSVQHEIKRSVEEISKEAESVDLVSAINESNPSAESDAGISRSAAAAGGNGDTVQGNASKTASNDTSPHAVKKTAEPNLKKDDSGQSKQAGSPAKGKTGSKAKKTKKSAKKSEKAKKEEA